MNVINIVGAGMAGLLAANMLNRHNITIHEAQPSLPNNHSAVLRFGTEKVSEVLGIPFRKVKMIKTYLPWRNRVADCLAYSMKCTGIARSDRSITSDTFSADRWIAPDDLVTQMANRIPTGKIKFENQFVSGPKHDDPVISTIPMPALMKLLDYPHQPEFKWVAGKNLRCKIDCCDAFVSMYIPDPRFSFNRISITGDELIAEYSGKDAEYPINSAFELDHISDILGIDRLLFSEPIIKGQTYAKIAPIDDGERKRFLAWATDQHNIYSLGRFATWRPGLMLDDLVHDIRLIERWATADKYNIRMHR